MLIFFVYNAVFDSWRSLNRNIMTKYIKNTLLAIAFIPILAMPSAELNIVSNVLQDSNNSLGTVEVLNNEKKFQKELSKKEELRKIQAAKIDGYYAKYNLPLDGHGMQFVLVAEKYGLPYNLLPAIAMRESTGGKFACYNNPFGWGSCKIRFNDFNEAIESVGKNLGGANPKTARYYATNDVKKKLYYYNGTVIKGYEDQVIAIMSKIDKIEIETEGIELASK